MRSSFVFRRLTFSGMSLFDWFSRKPRLQHEPDRVFLTRAAKWQALAATAAELQAAGHCGVVVAHFPATLAEVAQRLADYNMLTETHDQIVRPIELAERLAQNREGPFLLLPAPALAAGDGETATPVDLPGVTVLVPEMHPLPEREAEVDVFAEQLPSPRLICFVSLEDPVMKLFAGDRVQDLLRHLGMKENEEIQSNLVSRQIRRAQQKVAARVSSETTARSVEEWMEQNVLGGKMA